LPSVAVSAAHVVAIVTVAVLAGIEAGVANIVNAAVVISAGVAIVVAMPAAHLAEAASTAAETAVIVACVTICTAGARHSSPPAHSAAPLHDTVSELALNPGASVQLAWWQVSQLALPVMRPHQLQPLS